MKRLLQTTLALMLIMFGAQSLQAYDFTVSGQILMTEAQVPAPGVEAKLHILGTGIFETTLSGEDGGYSITIAIEDTMPHIYKVIVFDDCTGHYLWKTGNVAPEGAVENFLICDSVPQNCHADFMYHHNPQSTNPLEIEFHSISHGFGPIATFAWDFGDGNTSDEENPTYIFAAYGSYDVTLTITTESGCTDSKTKTVVIEETVYGCEADFSAHQSHHTALMVCFFDKSDFQPGTWFWEFGDGETSGDRNPFHTYAAAGEYTVTLTINGADSTCVDTYSEGIEVVGGGGGQFGCEADFDAHQSLHTALLVHFFDKSDFQPGTWFWEFGDGETSGDRNPFHTYAAAGEYTVTLTINGADSTCVDTYSEVIEVVGGGGGQFGCEADFDAHQSLHTALLVHFFDKSDFQPGTWFWEFGDGETSGDRNPFHTYAAAGEYIVTLTINGADSTCVDTYSEVIEVVGGGGGQFGCEADFDAHQSLHTALLVHFFDKSDFQPGTWFWEFGDGETSGDRNPFHTYAAAGEYTVTLTINGADSTCVDTYSEVIEVVGGGGGQFGCEADFDAHQSLHTALLVHFFDKSDFQPGTWFWEFGDGETSGDRNPFHTYAAAGEYTVTLTINGADSTCVDTYSEVIEVVGGGGGQFGCEADFVAHQSHHTALLVHFFDKSDFQPGTWFWEFGDGETSGDRNPDHTYAAAGEYTVTLTINGADSTCYDTYSEVVVVEDGTMNCQANFWWHHNCQSGDPLEIKFMNNSYAYGNITEFAWDFGDGATSNEEDPTHVYAGFGLYNVTLGITTENGCASAKTIEVLVNDPAMNCLALFFPVIDSLNPLQVYFQDLSVGPINEWLYDFGDGNTSNEQNPTHLYAEEAVYEVSLTVQTNTCTSSFYYEIDLINGQVVVSPGPFTGISENQATEISLYPNPVNEVLNIHLNVNAPIEVKIINLTGQTLITTTSSIIDVSSLPRGIYFANIKIDGQNICRKFIK